MDASIPYKIAVLCDLRDADGRVLLLHRAKEPNKGLYSPIGGKLETAIGESPAQCAQREIREEAGIDVSIDALRLTLIVSECAYGGDTHWLMFVYRVTHPVEVEAREMDEGRLEWRRPEELPDLPMPETDAQHIWPALRAHEQGLGVLHLDCSETPIRATLEQSERYHDHVFREQAYP
jgi:8-oxo-dGTP diphosphatase